MKRWILYRHTSPSGKVYIGITFKSVNKRWNGGDGYLGYNPSKETRNKIRESHLRNIASYKSQEGAILRCCKGKVKRAGNFIWRYYGKGI